MKITEIKVFPVREDKLKAFVSIVLDECFMVNDVKVIKGKEGFFISMPSRRKRNGKFKDIAHPLNNETRQLMEEKILAAYEAELRDSGGEERSEAAPRRRRRRRPESAPRPQPRSESRGEPSPEPAHNVEPSARPAERAEPDESASQPAREAPRAAQAVATARRRQPEPEPAPPAPEDGKQSADEVAEHHLRDSFWGT